MFHIKADKEKDLKRPLPISNDEILGICERGGTYFEDLYVSKDLFINLLIIGPNGVFAFSGQKEARKEGNEIYVRLLQQSFGVNRRNL